MRLEDQLREAFALTTVTLLERHSLGWGASTRNGGIFHPGLKWGRAQLHKRYGPELGGRLFQDGVDAFFTAERTPLRTEVLRARRFCACRLRFCADLVLATVCS